VLEALGCFLAFRLYLALRRRGGDPLPAERRLVLLAAATVGAALGSKLLAVAWNPFPVLAHPDLRVLMAGKTIVGGLLGGLVTVEAAKKWLGETTPTGDLYVFPLIVGIGVGRIGCFLTGLADDTYGVATRLPWGIDFGDLFKLFMVAYLAWRRAVDFIKPAHVTLLGMTPIQLACLAGLIWYAPHLPRLLGLAPRSASPSPSSSPETPAGPAWQTR